MPLARDSPSQHGPRSSVSVASWNSWGVLSGDPPQVVILHIITSVLAACNMICHSYLQRWRRTRLRRSSATRATGADDAVVPLLLLLLPLLLLCTHHTVDVVIFLISGFDCLLLDHHVPLIEVLAGRLGLAPGSLVPLRSMTSCSVAAKSTEGQGTPQLHARFFTIPSARRFLRWRP